MSAIQGDFDTYIKSEITEARLLLWTSLIAAIIVVFGLRIHYLYSAELIVLFAGIEGIKKTARALDMPPSARNFAIGLLCLAPAANIAVLAYYIVKTNQALLSADGSFSSRARVGRIRNSPARFQRNGGWPNEVRQLTEWDYSAENMPDSLAQPNVDRAASRLASALPYIQPAEILIHGGDKLQLERLATRDQSTHDGQAAVAETMSAGLCVGYRFDAGAGAESTPVSFADLVAARLSVPELQRLALGNLAALASDPSDGLRRHSLGNTFGLVLDGRSESALIFLDDIWDAELAELTPNGAVVAIPARDICAFCDAQCSAGIAELQDLIAKVSDSGSPVLCGELLIRERGRWSRFSHPGN